MQKFIKFSSFALDDYISRPYNRIPIAFMKKVKIEKQAYGGYGIARDEGQVLFIPDTIKGDEVLISITESKKNFAFAKVEKFLEQSPLRIPSDCAYDEKCGGCQWLTMPYARQVETKEDFLRDALKRIAKIEPSSPTHTHQSSPRNYRNRALFRGQIHKEGNVHLGFMEKGTHHQVPIEHCLNVDEKINIFLQKFSQHKTKSSPQKFRMEVQVLHNTKILLNIHPLHGKKALQDLKKELLLFDEVENIFFSSEISKAPFFLLEEDLDCKFYTVPGAFQQVNLELNREVRRLIKDYLKDKTIRNTLDLYCGSGNLSLAIHKLSQNILGIEQSPHAIRIAKHNLMENKILNAEYQCIATDKFLMTCEENFDLILADPPRKGMKEALPYLRKLKAPYFIYMSCDPMTLARDLKELREEYEIEKVHLFDFFPNTYHLESLVFMKSSSL